MAQMAMFGYSLISNETSSASNSSMLSNATELDDRDLDVLNNWKDALDVVSYELISAGVKDDVAFSLGAYLYSADINHMPIILAGPNAIDIANSTPLIAKTDSGDTSSNSGSFAYAGRENIRSFQYYRNAFRVLKYDDTNMCGGTFVRIGFSFT